MKRALLLILCTLAATPVAAQSDRGRLTGTVYDPSGAVVPKAIIVVTNQLTQALRQVAADDKGRYRVDNLLPALYLIKATASGFNENVVTDVILAAGEERAVNVRLQTGGVTESIEVTAETPLVDTSSARIGATISNREVDNLPLNGRQVAQLYLLAPGATSTGSGSFNDVRFAGRANEQNVIRYDGVEAGTIIDSNPGDINGSGGGATSFRLSQSLENIQEFRVESSSYTAEHGRGTGGQITVITKSGSNAFHGAVFENVRNDIFDARNYFDKGEKPAPLRLNQFGGSIGGPIVTDRIFFFFANENLFQRVYVPFRASTLSAFARSQAVPAVQPLLAAFPAGSEPTASPLFDLASATLPSSVNEHFANVRVDARINDRNNVYVRFTHDTGDATTPNDISGSATVIKTRPINAIADLTTIASSNMVNDFKIGYNALESSNLREGVRLPGLDLSNVTISIGGAAQSGSTGIVTPTGAGSTPLVQGMTYDNYEFEIIDNLSWNRGNHSFKTGFEINPRVMDMDQLGGIVYTYATLQTFLSNQPSRVQLSSDLGATPSPFHNGATGLRRGLQSFYGMYVQDEWRVRSNITMNYGLRYDYFTGLREENDRGVGVDTVTGALEKSGEPFYAVSRKNFGPRLGITWAPESLHGNTVIRGGSGIYYGPGQGEDQTQLILNDFVVTTLTTGSIGFPVNRPQLLQTWDPNSPTAGYQPRIYAADYSLPESVASYTVSVQQALPMQSTLTVGYVGSRGWNLFQRTISNRITGVTMNPTTGVGIIQREFGDRYAEMDVKTSHGYNHYNGLVTTWNRRFARGMTGVINYTLGKNVGTSGGSNEAITTEDNYGFASEYGTNSSDIRHSLTAAVVWDVPLTSKSSANRVLTAILGDWQIGGALNARSGLPLNVTMSRPDTLYRDDRDGRYYTAPVVVGGAPVTTPVINIPGGGSSRGTQRPDVIPGVAPYVSSNASGFFLNPAAFRVPMPGTIGNLPRNALRGPVFRQIDLSLTKRVPLSGSHALEFRADIYNLTNRVNFANPTSVLSAATPSSPTATGSFLQPGETYTPATAGTSFGLLNATVGRYIDMGTARQIQLSARYRF
ncbi:MAG TPA: TonB-dependent receptor [Vicinamibacterales bacterium]|nr:TonB-dependent receptor [Vicinamibacterales bacterium]